MLQTCLFNNKLFSFFPKEKKIIFNRAVKVNCLSTSIVFLYCFIIIKTYKCLKVLLLKYHIQV